MSVDAEAETTELEQETAKFVMRMQVVPSPLNIDLGVGRWVVGVGDCGKGEDAVPAIAFYQQQHGRATGEMLSEEEILELDEELPSLPVVFITFADDASFDVMRRQLRTAQIKDSAGNTRPREYVDEFKLVELLLRWRKTQAAARSLPEDADSDEHRRLWDEDAEAATAFEQFVDEFVSRGLD